MLPQTFLAAALLLCCSLALATEKGKNVGTLQKDKMAGGVVEVHHGRTPQNGRQNETLVLRSKVKAVKKKKTTMTTGGRNRARVEPGDDSACASRSGICQARRYVCQGQYLRDMCSVGSGRRCCVPAGAWSILCAGHHNNRVRACDAYGCGAYNSRRSGPSDRGRDPHRGRDSHGGPEPHKAVDVVCGDFAVVNAPFSGMLAGPVGRAGPDGVQYDGVKILSDVYCVMIFNIRPYRYTGAIAGGDGLGYVLPLQDRFSGITSHLELQMCDGSDPSRFI